MSRIDELDPTYLRGISPTALTRLTPTSGRGVRRSRHWSRSSIQWCRRAHRIERRAGGGG